MTDDLTNGSTRISANAHTALAYAYSLKLSALPSSFIRGRN